MIHTKRSWKYDKKCQWSHIMACEENALREKTGFNVNSNAIKKNNTILSSPTHPYVIPKLYNMFYFLEHKFWRMMVTKQVRFSLIYTIWKKLEVNGNGYCLVTILRNNFVFSRRKKVIQVSNDTGGVNDGLYILYELTQYKSHHGAEVACATAQVKKGQARLQV